MRLLVRPPFGSQQAYLPMCTFMWDLMLWDKRFVFSSTSNHSSAPHPSGSCSPKISPLMAHFFVGDIGVDKNS